MRLTVTSVETDSIDVSRKYDEVRTFAPGKTSVRMQSGSTTFVVADWREGPVWPGDEVEVTISKRLSH